MCRFFRVLLFIALLFLLFGCQRSARDEPLLVYTYEAFPAPLIDLVKRHFSEKRYGEVEFERYADAGGILNQLILEAKEPRADVVIDNSGPLEKTQQQVEEFWNTHIVAR